MTREELQSAIQDFWDEAFHYSKHPEISDTSKAIALECMMDAAERKRCSILKRVGTYTDTRTCTICPLDGQCEFVVCVPFPVSWTVKMKKKQKETQDILSYHTQAAGCSDKARAKASGGRQPIEECGRTGL